MCQDERATYLSLLRSEFKCTRTPARHHQRILSAIPVGDTKCCTPTVSSKVRVTAPAYDSPIPSAYTNVTKCATLAAMRLDERATDLCFLRTLYTRGSDPIRNSQYTS